ncbi:MAG: hypothetical protein FJY07_06455 [Bacteroidetes bacterium]|nr:hypothetical protein [Bacteroidota bacterium]
MLTHKAGLEDLRVGKGINPPAKIGRYEGGQVRLNDAVGQVSKVSVIAGQGTGLATNKNNYEI